jgi:hypothetical protein
MDVRTLDPDLGERARPGAVPVRAADRPTVAGDEHEAALNVVPGGRHPLPVLTQDPGGPPEIGIRRLRRVFVSRTTPFLPSCPTIPTVSEASETRLRAQREVADVSSRDVGRLPVVELRDDVFRSFRLHVLDAPFALRAFVPARPWT